MTDHEARLERIDPTSAPDELRPTFDAFMRARGKVPNLFRVAAHAPGITRAMAELQTAIMGTGTVSVLLKELLSTRVSHINLCEY